MSHLLLKVMLRLLNPLGAFEKVQLNLSAPDLRNKNSSRAGRGKT